MQLVAPFDMACGATPTNVVARGKKPESRWAAMQLALDNAEDAAPSRNAVGFRLITAHTKAKRTLAESLTSAVRWSTIRRQAAQSN